jgi:nitrogen fixation/metabolism regulation signal transduction histidine kinase
VRCDVHNLVSLHKQSFIEAMSSLIKNAQDHAFTQGCKKSGEVRFRVHGDGDDIIIDYTNNGQPFPSNLTEKDFLSAGGRGRDSTGEGLGGAWIGKVLEAHSGTLEIIRDGNPLHFRIIMRGAVK